MRIEKRYKGSEEWIEVPEDHVRDYLSHDYNDIDAAMREIEAGHEIQTRWAWYRKCRKETS